MGAGRNGGGEGVSVADFAYDLTGCCEKLFQGREKVQCVSSGFTKVLHL